VSKRARVEQASGGGKSARVEQASRAESAPICAAVAAVKALHLREQATTSSGAVAYLPAGAVVVVLDSSGADWWQVEFDGLTGYARADYLRGAECGQ